MCDVYVVGKKHRDPFPKGHACRATKPLELVHYNPCYMEVPSNKGNRYFITFIDDFSRKTCLYVLKNKLDACNTLKRFLAYVERRSGYTLKTLKTDRGIDYIVCDDFLRRLGIKYQMMTRYTPQKNEVAKVMNKKIMDNVISMLHCKNLPKGFWAEEETCTLYLLNMCLMKGVHGKTPQEAWSGKSQI